MREHLSRFGLKEKLIAGGLSLGAVGGGIIAASESQTHNTQQTEVPVVSTNEDADESRAAARDALLQRGMEIPSQEVVSKHESEAEGTEEQEHDPNQTEEEMCVSLLNDVIKNLATSLPEWTTMAEEERDGLDGQEEQENYDNTHSYTLWRGGELQLNAALNEHGSFRCRVIPDTDTGTIRLEWAGRGIRGLEPYQVIRAVKAAEDWVRRGLDEYSEIAERYPKFRERTKEQQDDYDEAMKEHDGYFEKKFLQELREINPDAVLFSNIESG